MAITGTLTSPSGREYEVSFDSEPSQDQLNEVIADITKKESDTGQELGGAAMNAGLRGASSIFTSALEGVGAVIPGPVGETIRTEAKLFTEDVNDVNPVNPALEDTFAVKGAGAIGQGVSFLGMGLLSGGASLPVLTTAGLSGAASGADVADDVKAEGFRRALLTGGFGLAEAGIESIGGIGSSSFLKPGAGGFFKEMTKATLQEAVEEPLTGAVQDVVQNIATVGLPNKRVNPLDIDRRLEEFLYGGVGALPFGVIAGAQNRRVRKTAQVDGEVVELPPDITNEGLQGLGIDPNSVQTDVELTPVELDAVNKAANSSPGVNENVQSVLAHAGTVNVSVSPEEFDALDISEDGVDDGNISPPETINPASEGSVPGGVDDLGASTVGPATGSSAPAVSLDNQNTPTEEVNPFLENLSSLDEEIASLEQSEPAETDPQFGAWQETIRNKMTEFEDVQEQANLWEYDRRGKGLQLRDFQSEFGRENLPGPLSFAKEETPPADAWSAQAVQTYVDQKFGLGVGKIEILDRPGAKVHGWMNMRTGHVVLNAAWLNSSTIIDETVYHELTHRIENDPAARPDIDAVMGVLPPRVIAELDNILLEAGYDINELPTERTAVVMSKFTRRFNDLPQWKQFVRKIKAWVKQRLGFELSSEDAEAIAARIVFRSMAQSKRGEGVRTNAGNRNSRNVRRTSRPLPQTSDEEYLAAVKSADPVTRDESGNVIPLSQRFNDASDDIRFSKPLPRDLELSVPEIVSVAQEEYDAWDQDGDGHSEELGYGGICDLIAQRISGILSGKGYDIIDGGQEGDDHAYVFAGKDGRAFGIDISPGVYESGGGYSWKKKPNVVFDSKHVDIWEVPYEDVFGDDNQYSRPLPTTPSGATGPTAQVFGAVGTAPVTPSAKARSMPVIKASFFDASAPITTANTDKAYAFADQSIDPVRGAALAKDIETAVHPDDANIAVGMFHAELMQYAQRLAAAGDTSLYMRLLDSMTDKFVATSTGMTYRDIGQLLYGRSHFSLSASMAAEKGVRDDMREAETKVIPPETRDEIAKEIDKTGLKPEEIAAIGETPLPSGETVKTKVEKIARKKAAAKTPKEKAADEAEAKSDEKALTNEEIEAKKQQDEVDRLTKRLTEKHSGTKEKKAKVKTELQKIHEEAVDSTLPDETVENNLTEDIKELGVKPESVEPLVKAIMKDRALKKARQAEIQKRKEDLKKASEELAAARKTERETKSAEKKAKREEEAAAKKATREAELATKRAERAAVKAAEKLARIAEREASAITNEAERLLERLARSQSDTREPHIKRVLSALQKIYKIATASTYSQEVLDTWLRKKLIDLGLTTTDEAGVVSPHKFVEPLIKTIIRERDNRAVIAESKKAQALAYGERGSLKVLEDALASAPPWLQQKPSWRRRLMVEYFSQLGLSLDAAKKAAYFYDAQFAERLQQALDNAIKRTVSKSPPWAEKQRKVGNPLIQKMNKNLEILRKAVRLGVTDPTVNWHEALAEANGWKGFTIAQHKRMQEIDNELSQIGLPDFKRAKLLTELDQIVADAKTPERLSNLIHAHYSASALSGLSTISVQFASHLSAVRNFVTNLVADPKSAPIQTKAFLEAIKTTYRETKFAAKNDVYRNDVGEHMKGHERPLQRMLKKGLDNWNSASPKRKALGMFQMLVGAQSYTMRLLSSLDQGYISGSREYSTSLFTERYLRKLGLTREESKIVISEALRAKTDAHLSALAHGLNNTDAGAFASDVFLRKMYDALSSTPGNFMGMTGEDLANDVALGALREAEGSVGRLSPGVEFMDEGTLSRIFLLPLKGISEGLNKSGYSAVAARATYGFITIPFRTAKWTAGYSPWGFVRYGIHKSAQRMGRVSPYQQSYAAYAQERQRLREAWAGSILMLLAPALAQPTADDDPGKDEPFKVMITGFGPEDKSTRDAWMKQYKPYSIIIKVGRTYIPVNLGRIAESVGWPLAMAGAFDDQSLKTKAAGARGKVAPGIDTLIGAYIGSLSQRSSFQGLTKLAEIQKGYGAGSIPKDLTNFVSFGASALVPWKGATTSVQRLISEPVDRTTYTGAIYSNIPVMGPILGRPAINTLGDPINDQSISGRGFAVGIPLPLRVDTSDEGYKAYEVILTQGRGPTSLRRNDAEKIYGPIDDDVFYSFVSIRGKALKQALIQDYDKLKTMPVDKYSAYLEKLSRQINPKVANSLGLTVKK